MIIEATQKDREALSTLLQKAGEKDPNIAKLLNTYGAPEPRFREHGFATLMRIIVSQQISTKAAAAIWARVEDYFEGNVTSSRVLELIDQNLQGCGLSWRKVEYSKALASRFESGDLNSEGLAEMATNDVIKTLTTIKGFGVWSAEIYAMFALRHSDVFPAGDLALQVAIQQLLALEERPSEKLAREIAERWSPYRSAVSLMLWKYYGATTMA